MAAVHSGARSAAKTDWRQIVTLYDQLLAKDPSPVVALHRAVAVAEVDGPEPALALVEALPLDGYYLWHAIRADLLRRLGRPAYAAEAYERAVALTGNAAEREFLIGRRDALLPGAADPAAKEKGSGPHGPLPFASTRRPV
jgi:RNA polymerase sigma-70 factor (ECF subfamily)